MFIITRLPSREYVVRPAGGAVRAVPLEGVNFRTAPPAGIVAYQIDRRVIAREAQFVLGDKNLLCVGDKLQPVCVVTVEMREKHHVQLGRLYAKRGQLLVDRRALSKRP